MTEGNINWLDKLATRKEENIIRTQNGVRSVGQEYAVMYRQMEKSARIAGNLGAAAHFKKMAQEELELDRNAKKLIVSEKPQNN